MGTSLISNPPYNLRWKIPELAGFLPQYVGYEIPPESNANMAFVLSALNLVDNRAVIILPNNVMSSEQKQEKAIMQQLIKQNLLLAVISMPDKMFESTNIPTCILVFDKNKDTRKIAMVDMTRRCREEIRDQRGQFGGNSHTGRTYHKTVNIIPLESMRECVELIDNRQDREGICKWVQPEDLEEHDWNIIPRTYMCEQIETVHRSYEDIAADYNRVIAQKNAIQIRFNKTAAKRLGYDCMDTVRPDLQASFDVVGQKVEQEKFLSFSADDGITIKVSTKEGIHPLILDFLSHWKQMIIYLNNEENRYLAEFRDALLPDLMSGRIEVGNADRP